MATIDQADIRGSEPHNHDPVSYTHLEQAALIVTTNLPFSEWPTKIPNARLCKAMLDRLTDRAHIIETGTESYRFRRTMARKGGKA